MCSSESVSEGIDVWTVVGWLAMLVPSSVVSSRLVSEVVSAEDVGVYCDTYDL